MDFVALQNTRRLHCELFQHFPPHVPNCHQFPNPGVQKLGCQPSSTNNLPLRKVCHGRQRGCLVVAASTIAIAPPASSAPSFSHQSARCMRHHNMLQPFVARLKIGMTAMNLKTRAKGEVDLRRQKEETKVGIRLNGVPQARIIGV